jgi:hypothetical protein
MKKDFKQELTELINKHGLEKEMRDTPDYILAEICIDAMAVFTEAIALRDEWHGFRKAEHNGNFSYEVRFDKKDGTPSVRVTSIYPLLKTDKMEKEQKNAPEL